MKPAFRKGIQYGLLIVLPVVAIVAFFLFRSQPLSPAGVTIDVMYMRYACGDCYVQYRVLDVFDSDGKRPEPRDFENESRSPVRFQGWDVVVRYRGSTSWLDAWLEEALARQRLHDPDGNCSPPAFRLKGQFRRRPLYALLFNGDWYDGTYFDATSASAIYRENPGCFQPSGTFPVQ